MRRYINDLAQYCLSKDNIDKVYFWGNLSVYYGTEEIDSKKSVATYFLGLASGAKSPTCSNALTKSEPLSKRSSSPYQLFSFTT